MWAPHGIPAPTLGAVFPFWKDTPLSLTGNEFKHVRLAQLERAQLGQRNYRVISGLAVPKQIEPSVKIKHICDVKIPINHGTEKISLHFLHRVPSAKDSSWSKYTQHGNGTET